MRPNRKVLLIDDDEINNFLVSEWVKSNFEHIELIVVFDASDAIKYLESCTPTQFPELIICDLKMPGYDGFDFLQFYENKFYQENLLTRIIILSANIAERDQQRLKAFGWLTAIMVKKTAQENFQQIKDQYLD